MILPEAYSKIAAYWHDESIICIRNTLPAKIAETPLGQIWEYVGMPEQEWWIFRFFIPYEADKDDEIIFGKVGNSWSLRYKLTNDICFVVDNKGIEHFGNSSAINFAMTLVLFDKGCKRIQRECGGDSGADWDQGDVILREMEFKMREIDSAAFHNTSNMWPIMLIDVNG